MAAAAAPVRRNCPVGPYTVELNCTARRKLYTTREGGHGAGGYGLGSAVAGLHEGLALTHLGSLQ